MTNLFFLSGDPKKFNHLFGIQKLIAEFFWAVIKISKE
jgi:hypothetical protein